jgi:hypothetical protein
LNERCFFISGLLNWTGHFTLIKCPVFGYHYSPYAVLFQSKRQGRGWD